MHSSVKHILQYFEFNHLPEGNPRDASKVVSTVAHTMAEVLPNNPELTAGLRKLLEAKDCFVRAALAKE